MIRTQYATFWTQNLNSVIIYVPILVITAWLINNKHDWNYPQTVILDNLDFNLTIALIICIGFVSLALAYKPSCIKELVCAGDRFDQANTHTVPDNRQR